MRYKPYGAKPPASRPFLRQPAVRATFAVFAGALLLILVVSLIVSPGAQKVPAFDELPTAAERKEAFFSFLLPHIEEANAGVLEARARLSRVRERVLEEGRVSGAQRRFLRELAAEYDLEAPDEKLAQPAFLSELYERVDAVPPSLVLAQAANETGWGRSRFAQKGRNFFGIWCWEPGCGIVPARRPPGDTHEVKKYARVSDSVADYLRILNTRSSYAAFRDLRAAQRARGEVPSGLELAGGLTQYSEKGWEYVELVRALIRSNDLGEYDRSIAGS